MKVVILCGGKGLRYTDEKPKGLAMLGNIPLIHHVMNIYSYQGYNDFILVLGYKSEKIINYFESIKHCFNIKYEHVNETMKTGGAITLAKHHILTGSIFMCTYCDSLANINIHKLISTHVNSNNIATLSAIRTNHIYGLLTLSLFGNKVKKFQEKPKMKEHINGGFFVFNTEFFNYIHNDSDVLETDVFGRLLDNNKLGFYRHNDGWWTVNTLKDEIELNKICTDEKLPRWYNLNRNYG